jgi:polysaccharide deacetylase 2 family uncharacterized protein YibQ
LGARRASVFAPLLAALFCAAGCLFFAGYRVAGDMRPPTVSGDGPPGIALVLDDCGANMDLARRVLSLDLPITWAIIPNLRYSSETADILEDRGIPFLAHVPMQAEADPDGRAGRDGYYHIAAGMSEEDVREALPPLLDSLEGAYGINNHRGSKATADGEVMGFVMEILAERKLFFLDSRTSSKSVAYDAAVSAGLESAFNSRFLDNEADQSEIALQMKYALDMARKKGRVAVICHLRPDTVSFLENFALDVSGGVHKSGVKLITLPQWTEYPKEDN